MEITHELIFGRIAEEPMSHLGGHSPDLLYCYIAGYGHARRFHNNKAVTGALGLGDFVSWFRDNHYSGPQGLAGFCRLVTDTDKCALELFFELRRIRLEQIRNAPPLVQKENSPEAAQGSFENAVCLTELVLGESMRTRTAMYVGNERWIQGIWAMWSGYVWAERDLGIKGSPDARNFHGFQKWIDARYPFAQGKNWGKVIQFLGVGSNERARDEFYDLFETFLEGGQPSDPSKGCREWIDGVLADVEDRKTRGEL
ncbi:MAG: hypothetical protein QUS14_06170 [Pyrinomonadaceae bacterium]|nr:hypothetical protein [Pyrinomonadaceae bacterium]